MCVSIIIPAYNSEKYLAWTLKSVLAQTVPDWEAIIVNDGSTDSTAEIAENFSRLDRRFRVVHQRNGGIARARNRGLLEAKPNYKYCMLLDHDDVYEPDALELLLTALEGDKEAVAAHGMAQIIDNAGIPQIIDGKPLAWPIRRRGIHGKLLKIWPVSAPTTFAVLAFKDIIPANSIMMRREKMEQIGGFDSNAVPCDDWDMWLRLSRLGHIAFVNRIIYSWRRHDCNTSRHSKLMLEKEYYIRKKFYLSKNLDDREKNTIMLGYRYMELYRARVGFSKARRSLLVGEWRKALWQIKEVIHHIGLSFKGIK